jgi:RNA polymerase sigma-70 factor, ECF subfamily
MAAVDTDRLWREYSPGLARYISRHISDQGIAEDILQDVFLKIHSQISTLRDIGSLRSWMYLIARNTIIDHYRSKRRTVELPSPAQVPRNNDDGNVIGRLIPCVERMVARLPDKYRLAILLTDHQGMTQKEMGERLGLSPSGAKSRVQRAREKLKGMLMECCRFELDGLGRIIDFERRRLP